MTNSIKSLATIVLVLIASHSLATAQNIADIDRNTAELLEVMLQDAWAHDVRIGRVAVESRVLVFRDDGEVSERIFDDTGAHDAAGTWALEKSNGSVILVLTGEHLRDRGRFAVTRILDEDAIELRSLVGERVLRFERRKGVSFPGVSASTERTQRSSRIEGLSFPLDAVAQAR